MSSSEIIPYTSGLKDRAQRLLGLNREVAFGDLLAKLSLEDQNNVNQVGEWLSELIGDRGEIWVVGKVVEKVSRNHRPANDDVIDLLVVSLAPNQETIELMVQAMAQTPPEGFDIGTRGRLDQDLNREYFVFELKHNVGGRLIRVETPEPTAMPPSEERNFRSNNVASFFGLTEPFAQFPPKITP